MVLMLKTSNSMGLFLAKASLAVLPCGHGRNQVCFSNTFSSELDQCCPDTRSVPSITLTTSKPPTAPTSKGPSSPLRISTLTTTLVVKELLVTHSSHNEATVMCKVPSEHSFGMKTTGSSVESWEVGRSEGSWGLM